ncbi:MAG: muconate cycloisomerase [Cyclobacteriaceae bacterium]|jgi:muconate cycloisomerase
MIIKRIQAFEVIVPANPGAINSPELDRPLHKLNVGAAKGWSVQFDQLPKLIIKLETSSGIEGWGELYRNHDWRMVEDIANVLIGKNLKDLTLQSLPFTFCREYDGFECAIWDAYAKGHGLRVVDLLGGAVKDKVKVGAWTGHRLVEEIPLIAKKFGDMGYDCIKFKCDTEDDVVGWAQSIHDHVPGMQVILDPNERWESESTTKQRIDGLKEVGNLLCLEDPIPRWQLDGFARLKQYSPIPIVLHISLPYIIHGQRKHEAIQAIKSQAIDGFNFNCGLADFQRLDHIASVAELSSWHGSEVDLGILEAMYVHSAAAAESCVWPSDIFGRNIRSHDLLVDPLEIKDSFVSLPQGNGLGVDVDMDAINNFKTNEKEYK